MYIFVYYQRKKSYMFKTTWWHVGCVWMNGPFKCRAVLLSSLLKALKQYSIILILNNWNSNIPEWVRGLHSVSSYQRGSVEGQDPPESPDCTGGPVTGHHYCPHPMRSSHPSETLYLKIHIINVLFDLCMDTCKGDSSPKNENCHWLDYSLLSFQIHKTNNIFFNETCEVSPPSATIESTMMRVLHQQHHTHASLNHWCHIDYFNNVLRTEHFSYIAVYAA